MILVSWNLHYSGRSQTINKLVNYILGDEAFQTVVLEKTPESPLDCKEIKPVSPKGNQP